MANPFSFLGTELANRFKPPPEDDPYYTALGRFVVAHAGAETALHEFARKLTRLSDDRARILFAGSRIGDVVTRIRGLLNLSRLSAKTKKDIEECLSQLDVVGKQRDKMVHRETSYRSGALSVTNIMTSKSSLAYERDQFTLTNLRNLHWDALRITLRLSYATYPRFRKRADRNLKNALREPWRYKPPLPSTPKTQTQPKPFAGLLNQPPPSPVSP